MSNSITICLWFDFSEAVNYIVGLLNPLPDGEQSVWLDKLIESVQKAPLTTSLINKDVIVNAAKVSPQNICLVLILKICLVKL